MRLFNVFALENYAWQFAEQDRLLLAQQRAAGVLATASPGRGANNSRSSQTSQEAFHYVEQILAAALAILTWSDACDGARFLTPCYDQSDDPMAQHHRATQRAFHPDRVAPCCARGVGTCSATAFRFSIC